MLSLQCIKRSLTLFGIGMFLGNGYELSTWRIPGVINMTVFLASISEDLHITTKQQ
jgi:hypothetical protein